MNWVYTRVAILGLKTAPCFCDMDKVAVRLIDCTFLGDKSNSEYWQTEFEFINQTLNFQTLFNILIYYVT